LQPIVTSKNEDVLYFDTKYNSYIYYHISTWLSYNFQIHL
jgi:hypothetical protein